MDFAPQFRAELFDADQWADVFARSSIRYVVPSKHHDGFCLWPSKGVGHEGQPWNAAETGPGRDLLGELAAAILADPAVRVLLLALRVVQPLWLADKPAYIASHMFPQFKDVVTRYRPELIFGDGGCSQVEGWRSEELHSPGCSTSPRPVTR